MRKKLLNLTVGLAILYGFSTIMIIQSISRKRRSPEEY